MKEALRIYLKRKRNNLATGIKFVLCNKEFYCEYVSEKKNTFLISEIN